MNLITYYRHLGKGKFKQITAEEVKKLKEIKLTNAIMTIDKYVFLNNYNTSFNIVECKQILDFVESLKKKNNENKSTN